MAPQQSGGETATNGQPVYGLTTSGGWSSVYGRQQTPGGGAGVQGECTATTNGFGVYGNCPGDNSYGVYGIASGANFAYGIYGNATGPLRSTYGVGGRSINGIGVSGISTNHVGVAASGYTGIYASASGGGSSLAGDFAGNVYVSGNLIVAGTKSFAIDHPLDPANKILIHACIESNDNKVVYDGIAVADGNGEAAVQLPSYFDAIASGARYQLTAIGRPAPDLHIIREAQDNEFAIAGANPGQRICWSVTALRRDPAAKEHAFQAEKDKATAERGYYLTPSAYGLPREKSVHAVRTPELFLTPDAHPTPKPPLP